jgi:membrane associated rhomboid family serine protease
MLASFLPLLILVGIVVYFMTPDERRRVVRQVIVWVERLKDATAYGRVECEPFHNALRERTPWALVTPTLVAFITGIYLSMLFGPGSLSDPQVLVSWGASFGPRTTNGEWWRLATATLVHASVLHLAANLIGLAQAGLVVERLVGSAAFVATFFAVGVLGSLVNLSGDPVGVSFGASPAVYGTYGLLLASLIAGFINGAELKVPVLALARMVPAAVVFNIYNLMSGGFDNAEMTGLALGFAGGLVLEFGFSEYKPSVRRLAGASFATLVIAVVTSVPLRGLTDVRPEIAQIVALEERTAKAYDVAVGRFRNGTIASDDLRAVIDGSIMPELQAARARLKALNGVPADHQSIVAAADEFLRLRDESWKLRRDGLEKKNLGTLRKAERVERESFQALERLK